MPIFDDILSRSEFADDPPVLCDIGAASGVHPRWKPIARHCIALAFEPDERERAAVEKQGLAFRSFHVVPRIVTDQPGDAQPFYLTQRPQCSSMLEPDDASLRDYLIADFFKVKQTATLPATRLRETLESLALPRIDWLKTDSQGLDLRLFRSLGDDLMRQALAVEMEPGIMRCYKGEDRLQDVLPAMEQLGFFLAELDVRGPRRLSPAVADEHFSGILRKSLPGMLRRSPGWVGMMYLNPLRDAAMADNKRATLFAWIIATIIKQHGFALELAHHGREQHDDAIFQRLIRESKMRIKRNTWLALPYAAKEMLRKWLR